MPNTHLVPELGVEIPADLSPMELMTRAEAACNTVAYLQACGLEDEDPTPYDAELSAMITAAYAIDPNQTSKDMTDQAFSSLSIPTVRLVGSILDEFGVSAARSAIALRNLVENKLVIETENPDARIRLRAIELIGKMPEVGAFVERKEVAITHVSVSETRQKLHEKISKLRQEITVEGEFLAVDELKKSVMKPADE